MFLDNMYPIIAKNSHKNLIKWKIREKRGTETVYSSLSLIG